jgi:hypothetical protein
MSHRRVMRSRIAGREAGWQAQSEQAVIALDSIFIHNEAK